MRNGATTLAVAMLSRRWKTAASSQKTSGRYLPSFTRSLTSALWRRRRTTTKTGNPDLGPTWPEAWSRTKGQHLLSGAALSLFPTGTMRENAGCQPTMQRRLQWYNPLLIRAKPRPSLFRGKALCWKVLRRYFPRRKRKSGRKRLSAVCMRCSVNTGRPWTIRPDHRQHCPSGLSMV